MNKDLMSEKTEDDTKNKQNSNIEHLKAKLSVNYGVQIVLLYKKYVYHLKLIPSK